MTTKYNVSDNETFTVTEDDPTDVLGANYSDITINGNGNDEIKANTNRKLIINGDRYNYLLSGDCFTNTAR